MDELGILPPNEACFTTVVKRPVTEETPLSKEELRENISVLAAEIDRLGPTHIITLGNLALQAVTGHSGITNWRGKECTGLGNTMVIPTYHPSVVLRSPKFMVQFKSDLYKASTLMTGGTRNFTPVIHYVTTKETLRDLIRHLEMTSKNHDLYGSLDLETTTYDYWRPETHVMTMSICLDGINTWAIPMEHARSPWLGQTKKIMAYLKPYLETEFKFFVGNNWKFDLHWMRMKYNVNVNFGPDNMLISYANDENSPHGLKYQSAIHCDAPHYDKDVVWPKEYDPVVDDIVKKVAEYDQMNLMKLLEYNALDAYYTWHVYPAERDVLLKDVRVARIYKHLLEKGSKVFTLIEEAGMWVDPERIKQATEECGKQIETTLASLNAMIPTGWVEQHLGKKQLKEGFNWNSTKQLGELFFQEDGFNFPTLLATKTGKPSTAESVLIELNSEVDHPALNQLMEYRKWAKYMSTYLKPWGAKLDGNSRIHPSFKLHGTVTGRLSGEDGVHQVPRDNFIRRLIGAPPGWSFFEIDGSQIELRVVAAVSGESTMLRVFSLGGDIHRETASGVTGKDPKDITSDERKKAKAVNFGFVYGMGWKKFKVYSWEKYGIRLSDAEAKLARVRFFEKYGDLQSWHARMRKLVRALGYVISPIGRKRRLPDIFSIDEGVQSAAEREAINSPVQGFGSDYVLAALIDFVLNVIMVEDPGFSTIIPIGSVHDAQYFQIKNDKIDYWTAKIKANFDDPSRLQKWFGYTPPLPITGDCKIGNHWGDAKDWVPGTPLPYERR